MDVSEAGLALTMAFEGLRLKAYQDTAGVWTIGYGHTGSDVHANRCVSEAEAKELLQGDLRGAAVDVGRLVKVALEQHQFDALVDFCFNVGCGHLAHSTLLRKLNAGDLVGAGEEFGAWVNVHLRPAAGLERRRAAEAAMFSGANASTWGVVAPR